VHGSTATKRNELDIAGNRGKPVVDKARRRGVAARPNRYSGAHGKYRHTDARSSIDAVA